MSDNPGKPTEPWTNSGNQSQTELIYAGFWQRVLATLIDTIVLCIVLFPILLSIYPDFLESEAFIQGPTDFLLSWIVPALYVIIFLNMKGATPGKWSWQYGL